ncbi:hypothetical protein RvY_19245 [Ramazzottius varieornatus]|uniref:Uncharacterized protein n=1 Tax=Ramazzottius varieornatus TaxID=947166 RepID=A0A1D1WC65_RAMVA|nr:hypothetical protein RvY_19245 [Ramazzottius varieornatus]
MNLRPRKCQRASASSAAQEEEDKVIGDEDVDSSDSVVLSSESSGDTDSAVDSPEKPAARKKPPARNVKLVSPSSFSHRGFACSVYKDAVGFQASEVSDSGAVVDLLAGKDYRHYRIRVDAAEELLPGKSKAHRSQRKIRNALGKLAANASSGKESGCTFPACHFSAEESELRRHFAKHSMGFANLNLVLSLEALVIIVSFLVPKLHKRRYICDVAGCTPKTFFYRDLLKHHQHTHGDKDVRRDDIVKPKGWRERCKLDLSSYCPFLLCFWYLLNYAAGDPVYLCGVDGVPRDAVAHTLLSTFAPNTRAKVTFRTRLRRPP